MMQHAVDNSVTFEIHREVTIISARYRWMTDWQAFLIGKAEAVQYKVLGVAAARHGQLVLPLLTNRNADGLGVRCNTQGDG